MGLRGRGGKRRERRGGRNREGRLGRGGGERIGREILKDVSSVLKANMGLRWREKEREGRGNRKIEAGGRRRIDQ